MRQDNPHISKRRGGRKQTHRRFSLQAFHAKHSKVGRAGAASGIGTATGGQHAGGGYQVTATHGSTIEIPGSQMASSAASPAAGNSEEISHSQSPDESSNSVADGTNSLQGGGSISMHGTSTGTPVHAGMTSQPGKSTLSQGSAAVCISEDHRSSSQHSGPMGAMEEETDVDDGGVYCPDIPLKKLEPK